MVTLRRVEVERRAASTQVAEIPAPNVPPSGEPRRRWLRSRLVRLLQEDMVPCPAVEGVNSEMLVEYFERKTGEVFSASPGVSVASRISGMGRVVTNIWQQEVLNPALQRHVGGGGRFRWNRRPKGVRVDLQAWRRRVEAAEAFVAPVPRLRGRVAAVNLELVQWLRQHRYLVPAGSEDPTSWESGMALLLLWEVDHGMEFVTEGGRSATHKLLGFTRRLQARVPQDPELHCWLRWVDVAAPLMPGLPPTHHVRWSLRIMAPRHAEARGWYDEFLRQWREYATSLAGPQGAGGGGDAGPPVLADPEVVGLRRPLLAAPQSAAKRRVTSSPASQPQRAGVLRPREEAGSSSKRRRVGDVRSWLQRNPSLALPSSASPEPAAGVAMSLDSGHGRAVSGPLT